MLVESEEAKAWMIDAKDRKYMETENTATADEECIRCFLFYEMLSTAAWLL